MDTSRFAGTSLEFLIIKATGRTGEVCTMHIAVLNISHTKNARTFNNHLVVLTVYVRSALSTLLTTFIHPKVCSSGKDQRRPFFPYRNNV